MRLLDEGGVQALSIRSVAGVLGVAAASLYSRVESVDDLYDLALDYAMQRDPVMGEAVISGSLGELMLAYYRHLVHHAWAVRVIAMRAPRGPHYVRVSDRMVVLLSEAGARDPLGTAYILANYVIGSATTAAMARSERDLGVEFAHAPEYARLRAMDPVEPESIMRAGLDVLLAALPARTMDAQTGPDSHGGTEAR
ncbi:TetR/AcrR family transcriptional regulator [Mycetocola lacteus]|uniref:TetR/AcrR family transcriptional regulator n=1 Tax=Mycetocola lacteus TaxID=76637 RepID=UPI001604394A|nr:TetR/AcrR family transcriptional regulator C-terminal domain-containing protein [Mycetocola lacteus]